MPLPLTTTTITIERRSAAVDPYEATTWSTVGSAVPAVISGSSGSGIDTGGVQQTLTAQLFIDQAIVLHAGDRITDAISGEVWRLLWVRKRYELGLDHTVAGLEAVSGAADAAG